MCIPSRGSPADLRLSVDRGGGGWVDSLGIYNDAQEAGWRKVVAALHSRGTPVYLQLWHCGRASHSSFHGGKPAVSASAIKINGDYIHTPQGKMPYETPRALETAEIAAVVQSVIFYLVTAQALYGALRRRRVRL